MTSKADETSFWNQVNSNFSLSDFYTTLDMWIVNSPMQTRQNASVSKQMLSIIFLLEVTLWPFRLNFFVIKAATPMPGTIKIQGTTLNIPLLASGKLSWKYVGSQDKRMKKQLFWQKWQNTQALKFWSKTLSLMDLFCIYVPNLKTIYHRAGDFK